MRAEPLDVYCPRCDSAYTYYPEIPEHCWNCGLSFFEERTPDLAAIPSDRFPLCPGLVAVAILGGAIAGGMAVHGWEQHCARKWIF